MRLSNNIIFKMLTGRSCFYGGQAERARAVVKEGLRLHPPAPFLLRTFREGCKIGSYYVPEKTTLVVNMVMLGRRGCPSANLAYILIGSAVGTMVQCFDWKIKGDMVNMEEATGGMNVTMAHPLNCTPVGIPSNLVDSNL
ncbi:unnamed protein product [Brassica oleracea var. botrytis]|uniref:Uncharacterized protein n=2 Tax=Brassica TaxID=3705 RepID=A0A3P6FJ93_BRAOL|nr:unnamed protein product [Brassica napus]VDD45615.1 unnamed protein product [Brassica oleracea]